MAAPKKPKAAGERTVKSKAKGPSAVATKIATAAPAANGNGSAAPSAEMIRQRAYELFLARDGAAGDELSDWLTAEREMMAKSASH